MPISSSRALPPLTKRGSNCYPGQVQRLDAALKVGATRQEIQGFRASGADSNLSHERQHDSGEYWPPMDIPLSGQGSATTGFPYPRGPELDGPMGATFGFNSEYGSFPLIPTLYWTGQIFP